MPTQSRWQCHQVPEGVAECVMASESGMKVFTNDVLQQLKEVPMRCLEQFETDSSIWQPDHG